MLVMLIMLCWFSVLFIVWILIEYYDSKDRRRKMQELDPIEEEIVLANEYTLDAANAVNEMMKSNLDI